MAYFEARSRNPDHASRLRRILSYLRFPVEQQPRAWECKEEGIRQGDPALLRRIAEKFEYEYKGTSAHSVGPDLRRIAAALAQSRLKVFTCNDHDGVWPVGSASVVVAEDEGGARALLDAALIDRGLKQHAEAPFTLSELSLEAPVVRVLVDGDY